MILYKIWWRLVKQGRNVYGITYRAVRHPTLPLICVQNGQSDWPKSHFIPKLPILIGQMRFQEVATQDVLLLYWTILDTINPLNTTPIPYPLRYIFFEDLRITPWFPGGNHQLITWLCDKLTTRPTCQKKFW